MSDSGLDKFRNSLDSQFINTKSLLPSPVVRDSQGNLKIEDTGTLGAAVISVVCLIIAIIAGFFGDTLYGVAPIALACLVATWLLVRWYKALVVAALLVFMEVQIGVGVPLVVFFCMWTLAIYPYCRARLSKRAIAAYNEIQALRRQGAKLVVVEKIIERRANGTLISGTQEGHEIPKSIVIREFNSKVYRAGSLVALDGAKMMMRGLTAAEFRRIQQLEEQVQ